MKVKISNNYKETRKIKYKVNAKLNLYKYVGARTSEQRKQLQQNTNELLKLFE